MIQDNKNLKGGINCLPYYQIYFYVTLDIMRYEVELRGKQLFRHSVSSHNMAEGNSSLLEEFHR